MNNEKINIIGYGFIGQATAIGLKRLGYEVFAYDIKPKENIYQEKDFNEIPLKTEGKLPEAGINIICIADKYLEDGTQKVDHVIEALNKLESKGALILRTTMLPRHLSEVKFDFYWPEFLHERTAIEEFLSSGRIVVGRRNGEEFPFKKDFGDIFYCKPEEASHIKYLSNIWNSLRIAFINEFGDNLIKENIDKKQVIDFFFQGEKYLKWGNAFGGHCLPKDTEAYIKEHPDLLILDSVIKSNKKHKEQYPELDKNPIY